MNLGGGCLLSCSEVSDICKEVGSLALCRNKWTTFASLKSLGDSRAQGFGYTNSEAAIPFVKILVFSSYSLDLVRVDLPVLEPVCSSH